MSALSIPKGKVFSRYYTLTEPDTDPPEDFVVANWALRGTIRDYPGGPLLYEWNDDNSTLIDGRVTIEVLPSESELWEWTLGYYDLELYRIDEEEQVVPIDSGRVYAGYEITTPA